LIRGLKGVGAKVAAGKVWAKGKVEAGKEWMSDRARGIRDRLTGRGSPHDQADARERDTRPDLGNQVRDHVRNALGGGTVEYARAEAAVKSAKRKFAPKGVSNVEITPVGDAGTYQVEVTASPKTPVFEFKISLARQAEIFLDIVPLIKESIEAKIKSGLRVVGRLQIHNDRNFTSHYVQFAQKFINQSTRRPYTATEAYAEAPTTSGFRDGDRIYVRESASVATVVHEAIHMYSHDNYRRMVRGDANEGTTEYFTQMACKQYGMDRVGVYGQQVAAVARLARSVGDDVLANAYFKGNIRALAAAVESIKPGAWERWRQDMAAGRFASAGGADFS
jgi:hypothetical protein